jgi:hypothetical protein
MLGRTSRQTKEQVTAHIVDEWFENISAGDKIAFTGDDQD